MELIKSHNKALVVAKRKGTIGPEKKKVNVLDEENYTQVCLWIFFSLMVLILFIQSYTYISG